MKMLKLTLLVLSLFAIGNNMHAMSSHAQEIESLGKKIRRNQRVIQKIEAQLETATGKKRAMLEKRLQLRKNLVRGIKKIKDEYEAEG